MSRRPHGELGLILLATAWLLVSSGSAQTNIVLHLKSGDRLVGTIVSEDATNVVITGAWIKNLSIPLEAIARREAVPAAGLTSLPATNLVAVAPPAPPKPVTPPAPPPKNWKTKFEVGANMVQGAVDRELYWGKLNFTYAQPYKSDPKKFFRTTLDYGVDYGRSDGVKSTDRMGGNVKTDFDVGQRLYLYNLGGLGYDDIRRIDLYYNVGPGVGYHLFTMPKFVLNTELGVNYQVEERSSSSDSRSIFGRAAEEMTWRIADKVTFTEKFELFPNLEETGEWRARLEATLSFPLVRNFSLNLSVIDIYDTDPARAVDKNELQFRSSIGVSF